VGSIATNLSRYANSRRSLSSRSETILAASEVSDHFRPDRPLNADLSEFGVQVPSTTLTPPSPSSHIPFSPKLLDRYSFAG
jgi:hypothetical protein